MKIVGQTKLEHLPADLRARLRALWVESVEEYLAMMAASDSGLLANALGIPAGTMAETRQRACAFIAPTKAETLMQPQAGGALGCRIQPDLLNEFKAHGRLGAPSQTRAIGFDERKFPKDVRLMNRLLAVKNQGGRNTCVAFAAAALREFLARKKAELSEQFLYWACKQLDCWDGPGTFIHTAMSALNKYGVCESSIWPYNPTQIDENESQSPPPQNAENEARKHRMLHTRTVESSLIEHYKQMLAGDGEAPGMPVVFGTLVFASWYMSVETNRTGKITMPLPGEMPLPGGHAMCVVGYVDDESVPGGGYFIIRNSWGQEWAPDNPEAPGHALMPYAYVELFTLEAFAGPATRQAISLPVQDGDLSARGITRTLNEAGRDVEGRLLRSGTRVLYHPSVPEDFMEDTDRNRSRFQSLDYAWTKQTRQKIWFPPVGEMASDLQKRLDEIRSARERFISALDESVVTSVSMPFPRLHNPVVYNLIPYEWEPSIKRTEKVADLTSRLLAVLKRHSGAPQELEWPEEWKALVSGLNMVRLYSVSGFLLQSHVVVGYVTKFVFKPNDQPKIVPLDQALISAVQELYWQWLDEHRLSKPEFIFFSVGTTDPVGENIEGNVTGNHWLAISHLLPDGKWLTKVPPPFSYRLALRDFLDQMEPETRQQRIVRIKECVDELLIEGGNITVDRIKRETANRRSVVRHKNEKGYCRSVIRQAFVELQTQAPDVYRLWKNKDGQLAVRQTQKGEPITITSASFNRKWIRRHALRIAGVFFAAGVGVLVTCYRDWLGLSGFMGFFIAVPILYTGSCMQAFFNRRAEKEKE